MPQDQTTGAAAAEWGLRAGGEVGSRLGGTRLSPHSNEFLIDGKHIAVKTAAARTDQVGVTYAMLERVDAVFGAWEIEAGKFDVWSLSADLFRQHARETKSKGASAGKVGLVRRRTFEELGTRVATIEI